MGKHDNRRSMKMRQKIGRKKKKARVKRQKAAARAARPKPATSGRKKAAPKAT